MDEARGWGVAKRGQGNFSKRKLIIEFPSWHGICFTSRNTLSLSTLYGDGGWSFSTPFFQLLLRSPLSLTLRSLSCPRAFSANIRIHYTRHRGRLLLLHYTSRPEASYTRRYIFPFFFVEFAQYTRRVKLL